MNDREKLWKSYRQVSERERKKVLQMIMKDG